MKAIVHERYGGPEVLQFATVAKPTPGPRDLLVRVKAVSVNPVDTKRRQAGPPDTPVPNPPAILGWDAAGLVEAVGEEVTLFAAGDEVYFAGDITRPGSYAEYVAVDERIVGRKPRLLSFEEAAAIPLTALTAWEGLFEMMDAQAGHSETPRAVLIVGGAGGVGSIAIQIAKQVAGLRVVATASRPESVEQCRRMGADAVINHYQDFAPQLAASGFAGVEYILSTAPLDNFKQLAASLKPLGKICCIVGGEAARSLDVSGLIPIRGSLAYELMFTRPRFGVEPEKQGQILNRVAGLLDNKTLRTTVTQVESWEAAQDVHRAIESGRTIGKIVMRVG
jgi:zinc-binding alcohol dehydrogenase family protein